jgi:hypothetical protein
MRNALVLVIVLASVPARADVIVGRAGGTVGYQQTDRSAWVFGPSLEVMFGEAFGFRAEAQLELGNFDDPFGESNIRDGDGPHVNHVMFGPTWRPPRYARYQLALGLEGGVHVMHSVFAEKEFTLGPAAGLFVQAGRMFGPVTLSVQLRVDASATVDAGGAMGEDVPTTTGRLNFAFEVPIKAK